METLLIALRATLLTLALTGLAYPLLITGIAQVVFPARANGSLVENERGEIQGSELIGQSFTQPYYFQSRPSAAGNGYDPLASSGSNLSVTQRKLKDRMTHDREKLQLENPDPVPLELLTTSASGLDPHISPESAQWQISRVARARGVSADRIKALVDFHSEGRELGILGEPRVNVLLLNLALDRQLGHP